MVLVEPMDPKNNKAKEPNSDFPHVIFNYFSAHKTAMLEQLKESKKNADGSKEFFCEMCQSRVSSMK